MFQVHPYGILGAVAVLLCWTLAVVLLRAGMPGSVARRLSVLLFLEGVTLGSSDAGVSYWLASPELFYAQYAWAEPVQRFVHTFGDVGMLALYPPFLAAALQTQLTRPFGDKRVQVGLGIAAVILFIAVHTTPIEFGIALLYICMAANFLFALVASLNAWYISTGTARPRALVFALAFGFRDICWTFVYSVALWWVWSGVALDISPYDSLPMWHTASYISGTLVAVPLIAYGILRTQLFDIDLRIKWTIKQSTVAAAILAVVFLVSEGASQFLSQELGNVVGLLAAAVVMFFLAPLQRFAERVASAAMPNTENTPQYKAFRKMQVYEAAVSEAQQGGGISQKERALLVRLRDSLGISEADADAIEREMLTSTDGGAHFQPG